LHPARALRSFAQLLAFGSRGSQGIGEQVDSFAVRRLPEAALQRANAIGAHPRSLGEFVL
jgi:hypothetical protein